MLSQCANQDCRKPFLRLRDGKLFLVETDRVTKPGEAVAPPFVRARQKQRLVEHFWLCDQCASVWTLVYNRERGGVVAGAATAACFERGSDGQRSSRWSGMTTGPSFVAVFLPGFPIVFDCLRHL